MAKNLKVHPTLIYGVLAILSLVFLETISFFYIHSNPRLKDLSSKIKGVAQEKSEPGFISNDVINPYLGFTLDPNLYEDTNNFGFPGENPIRKKSANKLIVGIFGGSVAQGLYGDNKQLTEELKKHAFFQKKDFEIVMVALGGFKQPQQLMALNYFLVLGGEFDIIINLDGFNEAVLPYRENYNYGISPIFPWLWNFYTRKTVSPQILELRNRIQKLEQKREVIDNKFENSIFAKSNTLSLLAFILKKNALNKEYKYYKRVEGLLEQEGKSFQTTGPTFPFKDIDQLWDYETDIWKSSSIQMARLSQINGIKYFHFLQPSQYLENSKKLTREEKSLEVTSDRDNYEAINNAYPRFIASREELLRQGVFFVDLTNVFQNYDKDTLYIDTCCHFNDRGYDILIKEIARYIGGYYD